MFLIYHLLHLVLTTLLSIIDLHKFFSESFQINEDGTFSELLDNISENKFITLKKIIENNLRIIKEVFKIDLKTDSFNEIQHFFNKHNIYIFLIQEEEK